MTSKHYVALALGAMALAGIEGAGCVVKNNTTTGSGGTTSSTVSATNTTGTSKVTSTTGSGTGGASSSGHTFATATPLTLDMPAMGTLVDVAKTPDFYSFTAKAGDRLLILVAPSTTIANGFDPAVIDPAFGLYDSTQATAMTPKPIAYQNGGFPLFSQGATLFVQIPADGTYYVGLTDCNGFFSMGCPNPATGVTDLGYNLLVAHTSKLAAPETVGNGSTTTTVTYKAGTTAGSYYDALIGGAFQSATETQVFEFTPPADVAHTVGAPPQVDRAEFYVQPIGGGATNAQGGDLSDANIKIWATDKTTGNIVAAADQSHFLVDGTHYGPLEFSVPVTLGKTYQLHVQNTKAGGSAKTSFFFIDHYLNPLIDVAETEKVGMSTNDTVATAETAPAQGSKKDFYTIDGNISPATDIDYIKFTVPGGVTKYQVSCDAARSGSGLLGFKAELFGADGTTSINSATETVDADLVTMAATLPAAATAGSTMYLKMSATGQDNGTPPNTGTQYRCYAFFQ